MALLFTDTNADHMAIMEKSQQVYSIPNHELEDWCVIRFSDTNSIFVSLFVRRRNSFIDFLLLGSTLEIVIKGNFFLLAILKVKAMFDYCGYFERMIGEIEKKKFS